MIAAKAEYYRGIRKAPYDLIRELLVALGVVTVLVLVLSVFLSSPDEPSLTLQSVATGSPQIYVQSSLDALDGNSPIAGYGPPYNTGTGSVQSIGPLSLQKLAGVHIPTDTAKEFVLQPLQQGAVTSPSLTRSLQTFNGASAKQQAAWEDAYNKVLGKATTHGANLSVASCACGPIPGMMLGLLRMGQSGAMDGLLMQSKGFYQTDYTRPLLFMQNSAVQTQAQNFNLLGSQWGAMNETGNYPGQAWLWLYTTMYQIPPYTTAWAANTDALAVFTVTILTLILMFLPWIPGLNRLPRVLRVYRLIWRDYYREEQSRSATPAAARPVMEPSA